MAFDGITIANLVKELRDTLAGGRIVKIVQPEPDELLLTIKGKEGQRRLFLSADASLPLIYLTDSGKPAPMTAPAFCMLLRKHLQNGRITDITQPSLERVVRIHVEHLNEMGDLCRKKLIVEIMGKHSNIIFCDDEDRIVDSIKRVSGMVSSVREVLPGKPYFIADTTHKQNPFEAEEEDFIHKIRQAHMPVFKAIYTAYTGFSPVMAQEICCRADVDGDMSASALSEEDARRLYNVFAQLLLAVKEGRFSPNIVYEAGKPAEFASFPLTLYGKEASTPYASVSEMLERYYAERNALNRIRQKSADLRKIVQTALERNVKKYDLQLRQLEDTKKREDYRIYGELLHAYGYGIEQGAESFEALNYYTGETVSVPLDPQLSPGENAKRYFEKYGKLKRTHDALVDLTAEVKEEIRHLESVNTALDMAAEEEDLLQIKEELVESGYIRRKGNTGKTKIVSRPLHYVSSDGYDIYVGKNNLQNDELTFKFAVGGDWWFHAKGCAGSHVIVRTRAGEEMPDTTFEDAARLAAYYSSGRQQDKVEVDYVQRKHVKKPAGAKPGFVVYYTNFSMTIDTDISGIRKI